jgi:hypothetical protein
LNVRHKGYYRGVLDVSSVSVKEVDEAEANEAGEAEKLTARAEDLAKFLVAAIGQFEERFTITPREKIEALRLVTAEMQSAKAPHRKRNSD